MLNLLIDTLAKPLQKLPNWASFLVLVGIGTAVLLLAPKY